ncbi:MAG: SBBP repeat-containing protein [Nitrospirae bacterium]|nr:SBBP repeat-containing protein [Nitrospirota bacterium]
MRLSRVQRACSLLALAIAACSQPAREPAVGGSEPRRGPSGFGTGRRIESSGVGPVILSSTYLGGSEAESNFAVASDTAGNIYVAGYTDSPNFPALNAFQSSLAGGTDAFVAKFDPTGSRLVFSTYLGGTSDDSAAALAVDASGAVYVAGRTQSADFPVHRAFQGSFAGGNDDGFLAKLEPSGNSLAYSTFLGGSSDDGARGAAVSASGRAVVVGYTLSSDFPIANPFQGSKDGTYDAFVTEFEDTGATLVLSTYLGGQGTDFANAVALDTQASVYVTGHTPSTDFPLVNPFQPQLGGATDAFLTKFHPSGQTLEYSTFLGGSREDFARGVAMDGLGRAHLTGFTVSSDFPLQNPFQATNAGSNDAFVTSFDPSGTSLVYSTFLGGSKNDEAYGIALDAGAQAHIAGYTYSPDFPLAHPFQGQKGGATTSDAFVTQLSATGSSLTFSSYLGGSDDEYAYGIALTAAGHAILAGNTQSSDLPLARPVQDAYGGGFSDAFVSRIGAETCQSTVLTVSELISEVERMHAPPKAIQVLRGTLLSVQDALNRGDNPRARLGLVTFTDQCVEISNRTLVRLSEANSAACGAANVMNTIQLP